MQIDKQNKWKSQQIDKYYKNHALHWKRRPYSRPKSNSLSPHLRHWKSWKGKAALFNRLKDKSLNSMDCHQITKNQDHVSYVHDTNKSHHNDESNTFSLWSCLNCTYNNFGSSLKCKLCNTPNYSLYIKNRNNDKTDTKPNELILADYLPQNKYNKIVYGINDDQDDLLQIALHLSYQNMTTEIMKSKSKYITKKMNKSSFIMYWKELQNDKTQKTLFTKSCSKYLRETNMMKYVHSMNSVHNIFNQTLTKHPLKYEKLCEYMTMKSIVPSINKIRMSFYQIFPESNIKIKCILSPYLLHQFFNYGCHGNINNVKLVYTDHILKYYNICLNPVILPNIPDQELLIYGMARKYFPKLIGFPDDIIRMISCFYNIDRNQEWKFNLRNAPTNKIICYSNWKDINDGYKQKNGKIYVCLMNSKDELRMNVDRNTHILPIYSIHWFGYLGVMKIGKYRWNNRYYGEGTNYWYGNHKSYGGQKIVKFTTRFEQINDKKKNRKLERKWSAYHKLSNQ